MSARTLDLIPIIHTDEELGGFAEHVRQAEREHLDHRAIARKRATVREVWRAIDDWSRTIDPRRRLTRLYQDGLPVGGPELRIVTDLAEKGSPNHRVLLTLHRRGAVIMGTESPELLLEEYDAIRAAAQTGTPPDPAAQLDLLDRRDRFIAARIADTLSQGEAGVLFLGMLHNVRPHLADDIEVRTPIRLRDAA